MLPEAQRDNEALLLTESLSPQALSDPRGDLTALCGVAVAAAIFPDASHIRPRGSEGALRVTGCII